jgi:hypothetical protein
VWLIVVFVLTLAFRGWEQTLFNRGGSPLVPPPPIPA